MRIEDLMANERDIAADEAEKANPKPQAPVRPPPGAGFEEQQRQNMEESRPKQGTQEQYERVVMAAMKLMYSEQVRPQLYKMLKQGEDQPAQIIARITMMMVGQVFQAAQGKISPDVLSGAIGEILTLVAEFAEQSGLQVNEDIVRQSAQLISQMLRQGQQSPSPAQDQQSPAGAMAPGAAPPQGGEMPPGGQPPPQQGGMIGAAMGAQ